MADKQGESVVDVSLVEYASISGDLWPQFIDVRSPAEFQAGHIPGAYNVPLFSDEERAVVGTLYKKVSRQAALDKGLEFVGPKLATLVKEIREHGGPAPLIYCWRGGMRSESVCGLMKISGIDSRRLTGGYKAYRCQIRASFEQPARIIILGGYTGSGKTALLHCLAADHVQVLDLEGLANHNGSAFGHINKQPQPSSEQFENNLHHHFQALDKNQPILVENESRVIGKIHLPEPFLSQMRQAPLIDLKMPKEARIARLVEEYASTNIEELITASGRIEKKLGREKLAKVVEHLRHDRFDRACDILLTYYDVYYDRGVFKRDKSSIHPLQISGRNLDQDCQAIKAEILTLIQNKK